MSSRRVRLFLVAGLALLSACNVVVTKAPLFKQADALAPRASDKAAVSRLRHYQALHALNQTRNDQALKLLGEAEVGYAALVPRESLQGLALTPTAQLALAGALPDLPNQRLTIDPTAQSALIGLIEVRRYRAIVLRQLGRPDESATAIALRW